MADSKITDLTAATSVNPADVVYLVQNNSDRKLSISTLLANLPNTLTKFSGLLALGLSNAQTLAGSGAIDITKFATILTNTEGDYTVTIADGTYAGQLKLILCSSAAGTTNLTANLRGCTASFTETGHSLLLVWHGSDWYVIGGTATVTY